MKYFDKLDTLWFIGLIFINISLYELNNFFGIITTDYIFLVMYLYVIYQRSVINRLENGK